MSCCDEMRVHQGLGTVIDEGALGLCFVTYLSQQRRLSPLNYCPWCSAELKTKDDRPLGAFYKP